MNRIKELRKQHELTQEELGSIINVQKAAISKYELERATPSTDILKKLADYFNVTTDYLLGRTDEPQKHAQSPPEASSEKQFDLASFIDQQNKVRYNGDTYSMDEADKERLQLAVQVVLAGMKKED